MPYGTLSIVATPIGNLKDITLRALEVLKLADTILAEDTREAKKLCNHYGIGGRVERCDAHAGGPAFRRVKELLADARSVALVTDAGTPGISDPGMRLVEFIRIELPECQIVAVPGPSAVTAALSVSGVAADQFTFLGFPPHRKGRQTFFDDLLLARTRPFVLYESPHRLQKTLSDIARVFGADSRIVVVKELTKIYEEVWSGTLAGAVERFVGPKGKGEFVLILP
jgi:16S rRNA (cytidine1402-2'-O)-methyltransferase